MRRIKRIFVWTLSVLLLGIVALGLWFVGPTTMWRMDPELLTGLPQGLIKFIQPPPILAERQSAGGPLRYTERFIPGAEGDPPVRIVIVEPRQARPGRPGLLDIHGGGYMYGSPEAGLAMLAGRLVAKFGITVVSVDYRLAPGTRYPGSLHDNYAALKWLHDQAENLGVDRQRIGVLGFSAGGGHAAALAIYARDRGEVPLRGQILLSPMLDDRTGATLDPGPALGRFLWTRENNRQGWAALLGVAAGSETVPAGAVPMRVADLSRLPPTYIAVGSLDLFATESLGYAQKLKAAGVPVQLQFSSGAFHGSEFIVPGAEVSRRATEALDRYLAGQFGMGDATGRTEPPAAP